MTDVKISQLPAVVTVNAATDVAPLVSGGDTTKATPAQIVTAALTATPVTVAQGGTNSSTAAGARTNLGATTLGSNVFTLTNPSAITFPRFNADNTVSALDAATFRTAIGAGTGSGTVTSVSGTAPISSTGGTTPAISIAQASSTTSGYLSSTDWNTFNNKGSGTVTSVTGTSPVASSGGATPAISLSSGYGDTQNPYASKTANYFLAAPNGSAGAPTFRAIAAADIPTLNQNTTGTAAGLSTTLAIGSGGTGLTTTPTNGKLLIGNGSGYTLANLTAGSNVTITNSSGGITIAASGGSGSPAAPFTEGIVYGLSNSTSYNAFFGYGCGGDVTSGVNNTFIGTFAGANLYTGGNNIAIGYGSSPSASSVSNEVTLGNSSITSNRFWGDFKMGGSSAGTTGQVLTSQGAGVSPIWATPGGGGGLTNWTEAVSTSAPNATVPAVSFTATNAATNVDAVIKPKGTGALLAAIPDSTATGGNKRGGNAVDLQTYRTAAANVASGQYSGVLSGGNNKATQQYSTVCGGSGNVADSGPYTFCGGGSGNQAKWDYTAICGGQSNTSLNTYTFIGGGSGNQTSGDHSTIAGGENNVAYDPYCTVSGGSANRAAGNYSNVGGGHNNQMTSNPSEANTIGGGSSNTISGGSGYITIGGGSGNYADGWVTTIAGGSGNYAGADKSFVGGGGGNIAQGSFSAVSGGNVNSANSSYSSIGGGYHNTVNYQYGSVFGGANNVVLAMYGSAFGAYAQVRQATGAVAFSACNDPLGQATSGYLQTEILHVGRLTSNNTPVIATSDNSATPAANNQLYLETHSAYFVEGSAVALDDVGNAKQWSFTVLIKRTGSGTSIVGSPTITSSYADASASSWALALSADTTFNCLQVTVTGHASNVTNFSVKMEAVEVVN